MRWWQRRALVALGGVVGVAALLYGGAFALSRPNVGAAPEGERLARARRSPQFRDGRFVNRLPRVDGPMLTMLSRWIGGKDPHSEPATPLPVVKRRREDYEVPPASGLRATWLGHSTVLLEIDGARVLFDPVWGERASPFSFAGPRRWYEAPLAIDALPPLDAIVISHDHYDHLDAPSVRALAREHRRWLVPLGVGAHLEAWGVAPDDITELDWWEASRVGPLTITATPSRHFSGRWVDDAYRTLWAGWAVIGPAHRVFYSGDTAMHPGFVEIGERLGPFDLTLIEIGAYDALWADVHLGPEQAVRAHRLVRGRVMLPVHWGLFDLALHAWTEPMERVLVAAKDEGVSLVAPRPGEWIEPSVEATDPAHVTRWWPDVPWKTAREAPAYSSHVDALLRDSAPSASR